MEIGPIVVENVGSGEVVPGVFEPKTVVKEAANAGEISGKPEDLKRDLEILSSRMQKEPTQPIEAVVTPEAQQAIPEKFKAPDGSVQVDKIEKATVDADKAYAKYREKELELQRKMNEVNRLSRSVQPNVQQQAPELPPADSFEAQIEQDLKVHGAGKVLAKLFDAAKQAAKAEALADVQSIRQDAELDKRQRELDGIARNDSWVLSDEGIDTLSKIRQEKPWLNQSPTPWTEAYNSYLADQVKRTKLGSQVSMPNPSKVPTMPQASVGPVSRALPTAQPNVNEMTKDQIDAFLANKTPDEQMAWFAQIGFKNTPTRWRK